MTTKKTDDEKRMMLFDMQEHPERYTDSEQLQLTYDTHAVNAFLSFANSSSRYKTDQTNTEQTTVDNGIWNMETDMPKWNSDYCNQTVNGGISAELAKNHLIGASLSYSKETDKWGGVSTSQMLFNGNLFEDLHSDIASHANYDQWIGNVFYNGAWADKWKIAFNANYGENKGTVKLLLQ